VQKCGFYHGGQRKQGIKPERNLYPDQLVKSFWSMLPALPGPHYPDNYCTQKKKSYQDKYSGIFLPFVYIAAFFYF
jgi:hypothetical protein